MQLCLEGEQKLTQTIRFSNALARAAEEASSEHWNPESLNCIILGGFAFHDVAFFGKTLFLDCR
jgi:hypothetical protein